MKTGPAAAGAPAPSAAEVDRGWVGLADLSPAYFGKVMATGIVSIAAQMAGLEAVARGLFVLNTIAYGVLWALFLARMLRFAPRFFGDMTDHLRGPGYFTVVAGTAVLGGQFVVLDGDFRVATVLWFAAIVLWVVLTYTIFAGFAVKEHKPSLDRGISGAWLLAVVSTQSIGVLGALLAAHVGPPYEREINFFALSMWLWGGMLYIWMMALIFYRYNFFALSPGDLSPPYWINMGAMAISTLAGSLLIRNAADAPFLHSMLPFIKGFTVLYWATGSWWIPMLLLLGFWRHVHKRFPLRYDPLYWGGVFPLGMYAVCTHELIAAMGFDFLGWLPQAFAWIALVAWAATFAGLVHDLLRRFGWSAAMKPSP